MNRHEARGLGAGLGPSPGFLPGLGSRLGAPNQAAGGQF